MLNFSISRTRMHCSKESFKAKVWVKLRDANQHSSCSLKSIKCKENCDAEQYLDIYYYCKVGLSVCARIRSYLLNALISEAMKTLINNNDNPQMKLPLIASASLIFIDSFELRDNIKCDPIVIIINDVCRRTQIMISQLFAKKIEFHNWIKCESQWNAIWINRI